MRTPLSAIIGFSEAALDDDVELDSRTVLMYMQEIAGCSRQLLDIVNDLMDAAKLGSGRVELQVGDVDGDEVAAEVARHLAPLAEEQGLILFTDLRAGELSRADSKRLRQILVNLVSNAVKYTDEGSVMVRSLVAGDKVHYEVVDTGAGVAEQDMPVLFRLFEQTDVGKQRTDSTGFGLPVSLGLAEAMGGTIAVESGGPGQGTLFRLVLQRGSGADEELFMASLPAIAA
jgi:signal transduction histidine kinase